MYTRSAFRARPGQFPGIVFQPDGGDEGGGGGQGGDGATGAGAGQGDQGKTRVEFTPEQQKLLEAKYDEAFGKGFKKAEKDFQAKVDALQGQLDKLAKPGEKGGGKNGKGEDEVFTRAQLQEAIQEAQREQEAKLTGYEGKFKALLEKERMGLIVSAAVKAKVHPDAVDDVAVLASRYITHDDDGNVVVIKDDGKPRLNSKAEPMTVEEFVRAYVDGKPHLKQAQGKPGAGSGTSNHVPGAAGGKPAKTQQEAINQLGAALARGLS